MNKQPTREKLLDITFDEVYIHGYSATSVDTILKKAGIPKGSMYHYFKGKKALVLTMVEERLFPKMDLFFNFEKEEEVSVTDALRKTFAAMSRNRPLVTYGCPLYRLMVELSPVDSEFDAMLSAKVTQMQKKAAALLLSGIESGEFSDTLDPEAFAAYLLNSTWGVLSLSPTLSSPRKFIQHSKFILETLKQY
ncbi:TetR/AcrR family transcriptional regulator [Sulfurovum sp. NBC37-1]|uniref:TetR/AcrR family transcriptional regulator n=1 Tax=Sulfurovum sp. (strain NBC37-1) TaxID=387093 RepID=UPI00015876DE|nr:TetR/AcrR family transcriptional regulator [Sulfurovum sp. NBC37-1]BAF71902.1 transcriptional regulator, TetR family [Sulfurovum sp. NBC37-1]